MVDGLRERERVRDLFGRYVRRPVAAAERKRPKLGAAEHHVAVTCVDIVGSTQPATSSQPAANIVKLLHRFFAIGCRGSGR